jgi:hypothetical protein
MDGTDAAGRTGGAKTGGAIVSGGLGSLIGLFAHFIDNSIDNFP